MTTPSEEYEKHFYELITNLDTRLVNRIMKAIDTDIDAAKWERVLSHAKLPEHKRRKAIRPVNKQDICSLREAFLDELERVEEDQDTSFLDSSLRQENHG